MKKLLIFLSALFPQFAPAQMQVVVDDSGRLAYPREADFRNANGIPSSGEVVKKADFGKVWLYFDTTPTLDIGNPSTQSRKNLSVAVPHYINNSGSIAAATTSGGDPYPASYRYYDTRSNFRSWTDVEFKIIRRTDGELVYWVSTQAGATGMGYSSHPARDAGARIFYTVSGSENDGRSWIERSDVDAYSNYSHASGRAEGLDFAIGGVVIEPNIAGKTVGGADIIEFFDGANADKYFYVYIKIDPYGIERSFDGKPVWRPYNALGMGVWRIR